MFLGSGVRSLHGTMSKKCCYCNVIIMCCTGTLWAACFKTGFRLLVHFG
jgi:hypothetical protein